MLYHKCGGQLIIDLSSSFRLVSPTVVIGESGFMPSTIEMRSVKSQTGGFKYLCQKCSSDDIDPKDVSVVCGICAEQRPIAETRFVSGIVVCEVCCERSAGVPDTSDKRGKILAMLSGALSAYRESKTILTLFMKSTK